MIVKIEAEQILDTNSCVRYEPGEKEHSGFYIKIHLPNGETHTVWRTPAHDLWRKLQDQLNAPITEGE